MAVRGAAPEDGVMVATDAEGRVLDTGLVEDAGIAFDPANQHLDLTKAEKRRTTALMMAINAYQHLIIKDAEYLREVYRQRERENPDWDPRKHGPLISPATINEIVDAAMDFDDFIAGKLESASATLPETPSGGPATPVQGQNEESR